MAFARRSPAPALTRSRLFGGRPLTGHTARAVGSLRATRAVSPMATAVTPAMEAFATILVNIWSSMGRRAANEFLADTGTRLTLAPHVDPFELLSEHLSGQTLAEAADHLHDILVDADRAQGLNLSDLSSRAEANRSAAATAGAVPGSDTATTPPRPPNATLPPVNFGGSPEAWLNLRFDLVNPYAVRFAATHAADLVTAITPEVARIINEVVGRSTAGEWDVFETAKRLRATVGLNDRWRTAVFNRYQGLIDRGSDPAFASRLADTYAAELTRKRAMMIARTETMRAANLGRLSSYNAAVEAGLLPSTSTKEWVTAPKGPNLSIDGRGPARGTKIPSGPCPTCAPMDGRKVVGINERFILPDGRMLLTPPAHPHCRCRQLVHSPPLPSAPEPSEEFSVVRGW